MKYIDTYIGMKVIYKPIGHEKDEEHGVIVKYPETLRDYVFVKFAGDKYSKLTYIDGLYAEEKDS